MFLLCRFLPLNRRCHTLYTGAIQYVVYTVYICMCLYILCVHTRNNTFMLQYVSNSIFFFLLLFFIKDFLFLYFLSLCLALIFFFWRTPSICLFFHEYSLVLILLDMLVMIFQWLFSSQYTLIPGESKFFSYSSSVLSFLFSPIFLVLLFSSFFSLLQFN